VRASRLDAGTEVLEVGPGLGVLTDRLARAARHVVAIEIDHHLADWLRTEFDGRNVTVCTEDILKVDPSSLFDREFVVVANLPYHITSPALRHLLSAGPPFAARLVVMVQAEVADRIAAAPGQMSALATTIQAQARVKRVRRVPAGAFYPRPKVDSAVLLLEPVAESERVVSRDELPAFADLVRAGFKQPRKTLANSLADGLNARKAEAIERLWRAGIDPNQRPQALGIDDWGRLFRTA
jgi:16S rRNA (adenine1518-N6/adenine1519-N6)-dimethyltransferase